MAGGRGEFSTKIFSLLWLIASVIWVSLHLIHYQCRQLFLIHRHLTNRSSVALRQAWRVLQLVQTMILVVCYVLFATAVMLSDRGKAMLFLAIAVILAAACPDHWRKSGTLAYVYFEVVLVAACCSAAYTAVQQASHLPAADVALISCLPVVVLLHSVLVLSARRTHMPLTATAPIGMLNQFMARERDLERRMDYAIESFHAVCNINKIERALERVGSGVALALYDVVSHCHAGLLVVVAGCTCVFRSKSMLADEHQGTLRSAVLIWVMYGGLLLTQAATVGGVFLYYTRILRRSNPFTPREAEIFTRWWNGGALAYVSHRAGRWRHGRGGTVPLLGVVVPLMPVGAQLALGGLMAVSQSWIDYLIGAAGSSLCRIGPRVPGYITDRQTRDKAVADWSIGGFSNADDITQLGTLLKSIICLLDAESNVRDTLLEVVSGSVNSVGDWATYVLICSKHGRGWLRPLADALVTALENHNKQEYKGAFQLGGSTRKKFRLFGKDGMLRRVMAYWVCVAGVSGSWDVMEKDYLHLATAQSVAVVLHLNTEFASLEGLVNALETDMVDVFEPEEGIFDETIRLSGRYRARRGHQR